MLLYKINDVKANHSITWYVLATMQTKSNIEYLRYHLKLLAN